MKKKFTILMFSLLLAVGWTTVAHAQLKAESPAKEFVKSAMSPAFNVSGPASQAMLTKKGDSFKLFTITDDGTEVTNRALKRAPNRAPNRAPSRADITASATHVYSWYDDITYEWRDANGNLQYPAKLTTPVTNPYQIAYLLGTTYMNPNIPGLKYSAVTGMDNPYTNVDFGWDIPNNARWNYTGGTAPTYPNITIAPYCSNGNYVGNVEIYSIKILTGNTVISSWDYATNGLTLPSGWVLNGEWSVTDGYLWTDDAANTIVVSSSLLMGYPSITVQIEAHDYNYSNSGYRYVVVNGQRGNYLTTNHSTENWPINSNGTTKTVTKPYENGYTVFLVKVKDGTGAAPQFTYNWDSGSDNLINYIDTYIEEVQLLTDGTRLNEGTDDAGTMFAYSGELNRFYFIGKGNDYPWGSLESDANPHMAPTYDMYEEFSPTTTDIGDETDDFYSKLLYGNSYNVIHDCRGMNYFQHYFSMSGDGGDDHKSVSNLVFWIPDNRGVYGGRDYDEEYLPHVGLYTITLEATAVPSATQPGMYDVTCEWVSSLNSILDFPVEQDYELWIYVYDEQGNPVEERMVTDDLHDITTYTYQEPQYDDSYTIIYRVKGWPTAATNNFARGGDFFAQSNLDPVLIPGSKDFLSLGVEHYESDFVLDGDPEYAEHNYYRNFLTVANQNPDNALNARRIIDGEGLYTLYRFDPEDLDDNGKPILTKAADLLFSVDDNKINYFIDYDNQFYVDEANLVHIDDNGVSHPITGYTDPDALGCPTEGTIATLGGGGGDTPPDPIVYETHTSSLVFTSACGGSGTADDGASWTVTSDASESNFINTQGIHYGTGNRRVSYLQLSTSDIPGTIKKIVVNASRGGSTAAYLNVTVGGNAFGTQKTLTTSATEYTFEGEASGNIVVRISKTSSTGALYCKSIVVTYETMTGGEGAVYMYNTWAWSGALDGTALPTDWIVSENNSFVANGDGTYFLGGQTSGRSITIPASVLDGYTIDEVIINAKKDDEVASETKSISVNGSSKNVSTTLADYTWTNVNASNGIVISPTDGYVGFASITIKGHKLDPYVTGGYTLLNAFLDKSNYSQVGIVVFELPWKSIQVKLQDSSAGSSAGYFMIQSGGKLRFIMPPGYNHANVKFVIHNAMISSAYHDGTFTLSSSTGETETISFATTEGNVDRECIFTDISAGDMITITGTHNVGSTLYNYSPDFQYIRVYVQGGTGGIGETEALNLDAIKFVDQFKAETKDDDHAYSYKYVLKSDATGEESGKPEIPVQHTNSKLDGYYTLEEIKGDTVAPLFEKNVMNAEVNMTLSREPEIYYYTLDRKPNTAQTWEELSKLQKRGGDTYQEMYDNLPQYEDSIYNAPAVTSTPWIVERYDNYDVKQGGYNSYMSYVPIIWTHGDQKNRRVKFDTEKKHNSYGAPIWKTGVADVKLMSAIAQRQDDPSTKWTYGGEDCSLYMLDNIEAVAKMPTVNNVNYVPYMFRIFVKSNNGKLRGYTQVAAGVDANLPGEHYVGAPIEDDSFQCVWSGYVNDPNNENYGVTISQGEDNGAVTITFHKDKVDRSQEGGEWDKDKENAIFASIEDLIQTNSEGVEFIDGEDLTIVVRFYYLVEGFDTSGSRSTRDGGDGPAGYGAEGDGFTPGPSTALNEIDFNRLIESVTYVNSLGMTSDKPFDGINVVITRYTDGTTRTTKVVR